MRRRAIVSLLAIALLLVAIPTDQAWGHGWHSRVFVGVGPFWWGPPYPYWWYPPPYYVYSPPPVIIQEPPVYIQQPSAPAPTPPETYWYYCPSAQAYYPRVQTCPEAWVKVPPRPE